MKKVFVALLAVAAGVWGWVVYQVLAGFFGLTAADRPADMTSLVGPAPTLALAPPPLDTAFRNPFQPYLYSAKPPPTVPSSHPARKVVPAPPGKPKAVLNGILWGEAPVAILQQDGTTELVRVGSRIWGLQVLRIERHQVTVSQDGRTYTLGY